MPFTILLRLGIVVVLLLLLINIVLPLIVPRFQFFWMFRKGKDKAELSATYHDHDEESIKTNEFNEIEIDNRKSKENTDEER
jgi:flagellar basal body-associated protein FliL